MMKNSAMALKMEANMMNVRVHSKRGESQSDHIAGSKNRNFEVFLKKKSAIISVHGAESSFSTIPFR